MNYFKLLDRVGFKREKIAALPVNSRESVEYPILSEREEFANSHRYYTSFSYKVNDTITIWINAYKMVTYSGWLIDSSKDNHYHNYSLKSVVTRIYIGGRETTSTIGDNLWEQVLYSLPKEYEYIRQQLLRKSQIDRL